MNMKITPQMRLASKLLVLSSATNFDQSNSNKVVNAIRAGAAKWANERLDYLGTGAHELRTAEECLRVAERIIHDKNC